MDRPRFGLSSKSPSEWPSSSHTHTHTHTHTQEIGPSVGRRSAFDLYRFFVVVVVFFLSAVIA